MGKIARTHQAPLLVRPSWAVQMGLNEAILLQELCNLERLEKPDENGHRWITRSAEQLRELFPFWSADTIARTLKSLQRQGLLVLKRQRTGVPGRAFAYHLTDESDAHAGNAALCGKLLA